MQLYQPSIYETGDFYESYERLTIFSLRVYIMSGALTMSLYLTHTGDT